MISEGKYITIHEEGVKRLTLKQILQSLPIVFAQVKTDNTSQNLLNHILFVLSESEIDVTI